jgi:hypothetical protein
MIRKNYFRSIVKKLYDLYLSTKISLKITKKKGIKKNRAT